MIVGIVAAKANSNRFPGKNLYELKGEPMFWHSVKPLLESKKIHKVYVATDSEEIRSYCAERGVGVIWRPKNSTVDDDPLLSVLKFAYYSLDIAYDMVVTIMANCPGHSVESVDKAISMMETGHFWEIRSFNKDDEEAGLMIYGRHVMTKMFQVSSYIGAVRTDVNEIHHKEDIKDI